MTLLDLGEHCVVIGRASDYFGFKPWHVGSGSNFRPYCHRAGTPGAGGIPLQNSFLNRVAIVEADLSSVNLSVLGRAAAFYRFVLFIRCFAYAVH